MHEPTKKAYTYNYFPDRFCQIILLIDIGCTISKMDTIVMVLHLTLRLMGVLLLNNV